MISANTILMIIAGILISISSQAISDSSMYKILELEKQVMMNFNNKDRTNLLIEKSRLYQSINQFDNALITLDRINISDIDNTNECDYYYEKSLNFFLNKSFRQSLLSFRSFEYLCTENLMNSKYLQLAVLLENELWDEFREEYLIMIRETEVDSITFMNDFTEPEWKNPQLYKRMSNIIPGRGLVKAGETRKGVTNLFLNVAAISFAAYNFYYGFYATGLFSGLMPAKRFYTGGKILTISSVESYNEKQIADMKHTGYIYLKKLSLY